MRFSLVQILLILFYIRIAVFQVKRDGITIDIYTVFQIGAIVLIALILLFQKKQNIRMSSLIGDKTYVFLFLFYLVGAISVVWSEMPFFSFYMAFQDIVLMGAAYYLVSLNNDFIEMEVYFIKLLFLMIIISFIGYVAIHPLSMVFNYHDLVTSAIAAILFCYSVGELIALKSSNTNVWSIKRKRLLKRTLILSLLVLAVSTSSGANVSALFGLLSLVVFGKNIFLKLLFGMLAAIIIINPDIIQQLISLLLPGKSLEGIRTAGYRMHMWENYFEMIQERPLLGWGFASIERLGLYYNNDSHNSYIGAVGGVGIIGSIFLLIFIVKKTLAIYQYRILPGYWGIFAAFSAVLMNANTFGFISSKATEVTVAFFFLVAFSYVCANRPYISDKS